MICVVYVYHIRESLFIRKEINRITHRNFSTFTTYITGQMHVVNKKRRDNVCINAHRGARVPADPLFSNLTLDLLDHLEARAIMEIACFMFKSDETIV
jgi:hypothetical protein